MASLNKVFLIGNLTRDPELRYVPSGAPVASFGLAVNRRFVTQSGEKKDEVCFVRIVVFGKQAESCSQYLNKGRLVFIEGRLQYRSWEQDGQKKSSLDIVADRVQFLGPPRTSNDAGGGDSAPAAEASPREAVAH
ncbi:MAG: single-stranded DNA-binding protein, partial [Candidatus Omnitrophota bacterium]|nr:single-stranded DNA-binding protein [Candidatus Omnitrophota bacterium]